MPRRSTPRSLQFDALESRRLLTVNLVADLNTDPIDAGAFDGRTPSFLIEGDQTFVPTFNNLWHIDGPAAAPQKQIPDFEANSKNAKLTRPIVFRDIIFNHRYDGIYMSSGNGEWQSVFESSTAVALGVWNELLYVLEIDRTENVHQILTFDPTTFDTELAFQRDADIENGIFTTEGIFFTTSGNELWKYTHTEPHHLATFNNSIRHLTAVAGNVFFASATPELGWELWTSDGTEEGTKLTRDISPAEISSGIRSIVDFNGIAFVSLETDQGSGLWRSDGTETGTYNIAEIDLPFLMTPANDKLYFVSHGDLWVTDGTAENTISLATSEASSHSQAANLHVVDDAVFFTASAVEHGTEIWRSHGTVETTRMVVDLLTGPESGIDPSDASQFKTHQHHFYFVGNEAHHRDVLWRVASDGLPQTVLADPTADIDAKNMTSTNELLFFNLEVNRDNLLFVTDGTPQGTRHEDNHLRGCQCEPILLAYANDRLVFLTGRSHTGTELWVHSDEGTTLLRDSKVGGLGIDTSAPFPIAVVRDSFYFTYPHQPQTLWKSDGTSQNTIPILELDRSIKHLSQFEGDLIYHTTQIEDGATHVQVNRMNVETMQTSLLSSQSIPSFSDNEHTSSVIDGTYVWFVHIRNHSEMGISDGTREGTQVISGFHTFGSNSIVSYNGKYYFSAKTDETGRELWETDGTVQGTKLVADLVEGSGNSSPFNLVGTPEGVFFTAKTEDAGVELWHLNETGLQLLDLFPGATGSNPRHLVSLGGRLYFSATDIEIGNELWSINQRDTSDVIKYDIQPGDVGSQPYNLTKANNVLYLVADDGRIGFELYRLIVGDFDNDQVVSAGDIDALHAQIRSGQFNASFDLTADGTLDQQDVDRLVKEDLSIPYGDANLDGIFNSADLVQIFQHGEYEDQLIGNSTWSEGDWNGDGEFDSADLVFVFTAAEYTHAAKSAVNYHYTLRSIVHPKHHDSWRYRWS